MPKAPAGGEVEELTRLLGQMESELVSVHNLLVWPKVAALPRPFTSGCVADTVHSWKLQIDRVQRLAEDWERRANEKMALRREVEEMLGVPHRAASDEQFAAGMTALRALKAERDRLRSALAEHLAAGCECTHCRTARTALAGEPKPTAPL